MNEVTRILDAIQAGDQSAEDLATLDDALAKLSKRDPVKSQLVELRYFAGLTSAQAALFLDISPKTADGYWSYVRAWIRRELEGGHSITENSKKL